MTDSSTEDDAATTSGAERYPDAAALADDVQLVLVDVTPSPPPAPVP